MCVRKDECQCNASDMYIPESLLYKICVYNELERHKVKTFNRHTQCERCYICSIALNFVHIIHVIEMMFFSS